MGSRDHEGGVNVWAPCARGAEGCLRLDRRSDTGSAARAGACQCSSARGRAPAWRRPGGFSSAAWPSGLPCGSASWCDQDRRSWRTHLPCFAALRGPEGLASPPRCGGLHDGQDQPGRVVSARGHRVCEPVPTRPKGPRWAVGSRTNRLQCLCAAMMPWARRPTPEAHRPGATLRASFTRTG